MLLQRLSDYADRLDLPPRLYAEGPLRYIIELDAEGGLLNPRPTDTADPSSPRTRRGTRRLLPQIQRTVSVKALLLADKPDYVLGYAGPDAKPTRLAQCHEAFVDLVDRCAASTHELSVSAVQRFLHAQPLSQMDLDEGFDASGVMTFRVGGVFPIDLPSVQAFWATEHDQDDATVRRMQCLVCGQQRPVLERLESKIKGVPGGQTSGTVIIGMNAPAFESYGLTASLNAPTCATCGERFTNAANALLSDESSRIVLGGAIFIAWTREPVGFSFRDYLLDPRPEQVRDLLGSLRSGRQVTDFDEAAFYATSFSGSGGRAVVRDWIDTTVGEAARHLARWFVLQRIVGTRGEEPRPLGVFALAAATVRDARTDLGPPTPRALMRGALAGTPLASALLYQAVRRNRAEQGVTQPRAALIKMVLLSQQPTQEEEHMVQLDADNPNPAYRCGRLLAVLEQVQRLAVPGAKATIVDRFFGTASSAPASVFARLVRGAQPHLGKLQRDRPGAYVALQRRLEDIQAGLRTYPRTLTLEEQGLFWAITTSGRTTARRRGRPASGARPALPFRTPSPKRTWSRGS